MPMICLVLMQIKATQLIRYKQLFQNKHSSDHAVVQLADPITESFRNNKYTLGVFIDLWKAFDFLGQSILLKKFELSGISDRNHGWVEGYLSNKR